MGTVFPEAKVHRVDAEVGLLLRLETGGATEGQAHAGHGDGTAGLSSPPSEAAAFVHVRPSPPPTVTWVSASQSLLTFDQTLLVHAGGKGCLPSLRHTRAPCKLHLVVVPLISAHHCCQVHS